MSTSQALQNGDDGGVPLDATEKLRGFGPVGLLALTVILGASVLGAPIGAAFVLVWARLSRTSWSSIGFARPQSWARVFAIGVPFGVAFKLAMKAVVMPMLGAPAINSHYQFLANNPTAVIGIVAVVIISAGFGEETLYRGYLFERLGRLLGRGRTAVAVTILITSGLFAVAHFHDQGLPGAEQAALTGLVFGTLYARSRQLWLPMVAHVAFDLTAVALIYGQWESAVAHWLFQ